MNKSLILVFALAVTTTLVQAQTSAGNMMVGGTIDFTSVSREGGSLNDASSFTFSPSFGYFISDNLAIGSSLTLSSLRQGTGSAKTVTTGFDVGPFVRYYKFTSNDRFAIFGEAGLGFGTDKTDPAVGNVTHSNYITFSVAPGAAFFFNEHWAFEISITGFGITSRDPDTDNNDDKVTTVNLGLSSFSPQLGFRYHF
jgi:hypothetical protein